MRMNFPKVTSRAVSAKDVETPAWRPQSGEGRTLTAEEKAALLGDRPDLAQPEPVKPKAKR